MTTYTIAEVFDDDGFISHWAVLGDEVVVGTTPDERTAIELRDSLRARDAETEHNRRMFDTYRWMSEGASK